MQLDGTGEREASTTMAFVRMLTALTRDKQIGKHVVPIVPDEARTFGMEGMFRQIGIYASKGQLYEPQDSGELMYYREDKSGQILEEGINDRGGHVVFESQRADGAFLYLLFDVRFPARWRLYLGRR
jgi:pyruvate dehydrogenase E1 component